jgi:hypothetical protein
MPFAMCRTPEGKEGIHEVCRVDVITKPACRLCSSACSCVRMSFVLCRWKRRKATRRRRQYGNMEEIQVREKNVYALRNDCSPADSLEEEEEDDEAQKIL